MAGGRAEARLRRGRHILEELLSQGLMDEPLEFQLLFHRLNNQLGIILAHAELLEAKVPDRMNRARAAQVVASTLEALGTAKEIRRLAGAPPDPQ